MDEELKVYPLQDNLLQEETIFRENTDKIKTQIQDIEIYLAEKEKELDVFAKKQSAQFEDNLRNSMYMIIDSSIVDGNKFTEAFENYSNKYLNEVIRNCDDINEEIKTEVLSKIAIIDEEINIENNICIDILQLDNTQQLKFEKGLKFSLSTLGAIGTIKAGAILGMVIAGPVASFFTIIFTIIMVFAGDLAGIKAKSKIINIRKEKSKHKVDVSIVKMKKEIEIEVVNNSKDFIQSIKFQLDEYLSERKFRESQLYKIDSNNFINNQISNYYNYEHIIGKIQANLIKPAFEKLKTSLDKKLDTSSKNIYKEVLANIYNESNFSNEETIAFVSNHLLPHLIYMETIEINNIIEDDLKTLEKKINSYLEEELLNFDESMDISFEHQQAIIKDNIGKIISHKLLGKKLSESINHLAVSSKAHIITTIAHASHLPLIPSFSILISKVILTTFGYSTWKSKLKKQSKKTIENWHRETKALIHADLSN